jgi:S1-C subfamily serine protease
VECEACGLIFAKYIEAQRYRREQEAALNAKKERASRRQGLLFQAAILVFLTAAVTYYLVRSAPSESPSGNEQAMQDRPPPVVYEMAAESPEPEQPAVRQHDLQADSLAGSIEKAREATVSIETPWGIGSGFFISKNCIVTNRHVLQVDPNETAGLRQKLEVNRKLIDSERQRINELRMHLGRSSQGANQRRLQIYIEQCEHRLKKALPQYEEAERQLEKMERPINLSEIKIIFADGSSQNPGDMRLSEERDLAMLSVLVNGPHVLPRPLANSPLHHGDKLYAVGSPVGLRNTVTAGIFSGYQKRESDGEVFLQTDAPINPGNSGGPLIDEKGFVRGVNTMILKNTEGIGFAIPIDQVFEDLGFYIY